MSRRRHQQKTKQEVVTKRWHTRHYFYAVGFFIALVAIGIAWWSNTTPTKPGTEMNATERRNRDEGPEPQETDEELHRRLFPTAGYRIYPSANDVDWKQILLCENNWDKAEADTLNVAISTLVAVVGKEDPVAADLLNTGKPSAKIIGIVPMDSNVAVGLPPQTIYIDMMWSPITRAIHVPRNRMGSFVQLVSALYHEGFHVRQLPNADAARGVDSIAIEIAAYEAQRAFNAKLRTFIEQTMKDKSNYPRMIRELDAIDTEIGRRIEAYRNRRMPSFTW